MDTDNEDSEIIKEQELDELHKYLEQLKTLKMNLLKEIDKSKKQCKELVDLAGELDAFFTK